MRRSKFFILSLILLLSAQNASAARTGLFLLANLQQFVHLTYKFDQYKLADSSSTQNAAYEDYYFKGDYAVLDKNILNGNFTLGFRFKQNQFSGSGSNSSNRFSLGYGIYYDFRGVFLENKPYPLHFFVNSKTEDIAQDFGQDYTLTTDTYGLNLALQNKFLPASVGYTRSTSTTDGLDTDRKSTRDQLDFHFRHQYRISESLLDLLFTKENYSPDTTESLDFNKSAELHFGNRLHWSEGEKVRYLNSLVQYVDAAGINDRQTLDVSENLDWDLGKALHSGLNYSYSRYKSGNLDQQTNSGRAWIQHQLYQSLITQLEAMVRQTDLFPGTEQISGGRVTLGYRKNLPSDSGLSLNVYEQYQVTDRKAETDRLSVVDEPHTVVFGEQIFLANPNAVAESIVVRNADPLVRVDPYVENVDYRVVQDGARTEIVVFGSGLSNIITEGMGLLISYDYLINPSLKFATNSWGTNAEVRILANRFRVYGSYEQTDQDLLAGQTDVVSLDSLKIYRLGGEANYRPYKLSGQYMKFESATDRHQTLNGSLHYYDLWRGGNLSLYLEDEYWWSGASQGANLDSKNTLRTGAEYRKPVLSSLLVSVRGNYQKTTGAVDSDQVTFGGDLRWQLRKLILTVRSWAGFRRFEGDWTREEHLRMDITRYF